MIGVRPSSGAAMLESEEDVMKSGASAHSVLAAPEDGRTPPEPFPAVTHPLQEKDWETAQFARGSRRKRGHHAREAQDPGE